jgi:hypothetical protein
VDGRRQPFLKKFDSPPVSALNQFRLKREDHQRALGLSHAWLAHWNGGAPLTGRLQVAGPQQLGHRRVNRPHAGTEFLGQPAGPREATFPGSRLDAFAHLLGDLINR